MASDAIEGIGQKPNCAQVSAVEPDHFGFARFFPEFLGHFGENNLILTAGHYEHIAP
jgi:hypothetical protein